MPATATEQPRLRIALQSPNRLLRESIADRLGRDNALRLVGATANETDLLQLCDLRHPEVVIVDPDGDPDLLLSTLRTRHQDVRIIGLSSDPDVAIRFQRAGACRVVSPDSGLKTLLEAIRPYSWVQGDDGAQAEDPDGVSDDEIRILHLIGSGFTLEQISAVLGLTPSTVERQKRRAFGKLAARSQAQAIARALRLGLLPAHDEQPQRQRRMSDIDEPVSAVLYGAPGPLLNDVKRVLEKEGIATLQEDEAAPSESPEAESLPRVAVLVDPTPDDLYPVPTSDAGRLVVSAGDPGQRATVEALLRGADAMIPAEMVETALAPALQLVASGFLVTDADRAHRFLRAGFARVDQGRSPIPMDLTSREQDILELIERGHTVRQTARDLGISIKTVETLQSRLFRKLGVRCSSEAIMVAHGFGLLKQHATQ
jgi:DNA-binding NarL/FixJ family response regulator